MVTGTGINVVCAQCVHPCKQFASVELHNCRKFKSSQSGKKKTPNPVGVELATGTNKKQVGSKK